ncbi:MAG: hypothetical protein U5L96_01560 [Owenweeksia sp.]|nr:hypothetical protein [Owenweeksia sp.]
MHLSNPVSQAAFYTEDSTTTAPKGLGQKLYAYANDQWDNIKQGRPVEFPKAKSPQLSINIDKILPN